MKMLKDILKLAWRKRQIKKSTFVGITAGEMARTYAKIETKYLQSNYLKSQPRSPQEILGYQFNFLSYGTLRYLFNEIFLRQEYCFLTDNKSPFIIDCGSNIGASILYFKKLYPNASIIGFEPSEQAFNVLKSNIEGNGLQNVTIYNLGLSGWEEEQEFYFDPSNVSNLRMSFVKERVQGVSTLVKTTTLSKYINRTVDFLKMDIEGSESFVIEELHETQKLPLIKEMVIEYHHHIDKEADKLSYMLGILEQNNFGYHISSNLPGPSAKGDFQDIMIYAYRKCDST
jgi:FkbM family methyltransferase